jgi:hypothetical protein
MAIEDDRLARTDEFAAIESYGVTGALLFEPPAGGNALVSDVSQISGV